MQANQIISPTRISIFLVLIVISHAPWTLLLIRYIENS